MIASVKIVLVLILTIKISTADIQTKRKTKVWEVDHGDKWTNMGKNKECSKTKAVVTDHLEGIMYVGGQQKYQEFVLPMDGTVLLTDNSRLLFEDDPKCKNISENEFTMYKHSTVRRWFSSDSWHTIDEKKNVAMPHIERIPCECDTVVFPPESGTAVDLDDVDDLVVDQIYINGHVDDFNAFLETKVGQRMFLNSEDVRFTRGKCTDNRNCGCHSNKRFFDQLSILCIEESEYCVIPHCKQPIRPIGHCCDVCGAILTLENPDACDIDLQQMGRSVQSKLNRFRNGRHAADLDYYISIVPYKHQVMLQLVVAETGEYSGISTEFMDYLTKDPNFKDDDFKIKKRVSGMAYIPSGTSAWFFVFSTLLFVLTVYGIIYVHYVAQPKLPNWVPISRLNAFRSSIVFARFDNKRHSDVDAGSVLDVDIKFDNERGRLVDQSTTGFNNPLFKREAADVESGPSSEKRKIKSTILNSDSQSDSDSSDPDEHGHIGEEIEGTDTNDGISLMNLVDVDLNLDAK